MAKKMILNHKITVLIPRISNEDIKYPIFLLNNKNIDISSIESLLLDLKYNVCVLVLTSNLSVNNADDDIYYFPVKDEIIIEFKNNNYKEAIVNNGYLDTFTESENIMIPVEIINE